MMKFPALALLALGMSACALETPEADEATGAVTETAALMTPAAKSLRADELAAGPVANVAGTGCVFNPVVGIKAYNGLQGYALCRFGYTVLSYAGQTQVFIIGADNQMFHTWTPNGTWESLGGFLTGEVYGGTVDGGAFRVCALGADTQSWYMKEYTPSTGWGGWQGLGKNPGRCPIQGTPTNFPGT